MELQGYDDIDAVVQGNTAFALTLYQRLRSEEGNLFFSPYSISTALAMTYAGARGNTAVQMAQTLHFALEEQRLHPAFASLAAKLKAVREKRGVQFNVANALWPQKGYAFLEAYLALTMAYYGVSIAALDYRETEAAREAINTWVEDKTEDKIKELIAPRVLSPLTRLVLVNAIYFKGNWTSQFDQALTKVAPFWVTPDEKIEVSMMTQEQEFRYAEIDGLQVLELPYAGDDLSMIVLLSRAVDGLGELEEALSVENLKKWTSHLRPREVQIFLPRFKVSARFRLRDTLISMGMADAFEMGRANFSGMDGREKGFFISDAIHGAFVEVNEEGTEAAAATAVAISFGLSEPSVAFRADHPFIFLIRDNGTGSILFLGRVVNPLSGSA